MSLFDDLNGQYLAMHVAKEDAFWAQKMGLRAYVEGTRAVAAALLAGGVPDSNVKLVVGEGATHNEKAWASRLPGALQWLYQ